MPNLAQVTKVPVRHGSSFKPKSPPTIRIPDWPAGPPHSFQDRLPSVQGNIKPSPPLPHQMKNERSECEETLTSHNMRHKHVAIAQEYDIFSKEQ